MYKLLILDIDGTLNNSQKVITDKTKSYIKKAQNKGVSVFLASGRSSYGMRQSAEDLELSSTGGYLLSFNGGTCIDCATNTTLYKKAIDSQIAHKVFDFAKKHNLPYLTYDNDLLVCEEVTDFIKLEAKINNLTIHQVNDMKEYVNYNTPKIIIASDANVLEKIEPIAQDEFKNLAVFRSEPFFLEFNPPNVDKGSAIISILEKLDVHIDEVIAVGDGFNDITMIETAGLGVAMGNAQDKVKEVADYITKSNDEDGVCDVIQKFILQ